MTKKNQENLFSHFYKLFFCDFSVTQVSFPGSLSNPNTFFTKTEVSENLQVTNTQTGL